MKSIVQAHGGRLGIEARPDGGLRVAVQLPAAAGVANAGWAAVPRPVEG